MYENSAICMLDFIKIDDPDNLRSLRFVYK